MGAKTKEVGGGAATGLSNDFVGALQNMLRSGSSAPGGSNPGNSDPAGSTVGFMDNVNKFINGNFGNTDTSKLKDIAAGNGFQFSDVTPEKVDLGKFNTDALKNFNPNINLAPGNVPGVTGNEQFNSLFNKVTSGPTYSDKLGPQKQDVTFSLGGVDLSPYTAKLERDKAANVADLRARFGAAGGASLGTPAAVAEGNYRAAADANNAATLADIGRAQQGLELQRQVGAAQVNATNYGNWLDSMAKTSGVDASVMSNALDTLAKGIGTDAANLVNLRGQDLEAQVQSGKLNLEALSTATGLDLDTLKTAISQNMSIADIMNKNQEIRAQNQVNNKSLNIDALSKALGIDESGRVSNMGAQGNMLNNILDIIAQLSGKGIAQRQTISQPGALQNILGTVTGIAKGIGNIGIGGGFSTGGSGGQTPPAETGYNPNSNLDLSKLVLPPVQF